MKLFKVEVVCMNKISIPSEVTCKVTENVWGFKWECCPGIFQMGKLSKQGKLSNGKTVQAKFQMGTLSRQSFEWEHSPGSVSNRNTFQAVLNGKTVQANFQMGTLSRQSFEWEHSPGSVSNRNTFQAVLNRKTVQANFQLGTLSRQSFL